jgi:hypothetical protein
MLVIAAGASAVTSCVAAAAAALDVPEVLRSLLTSARLIRPIMHWSGIQVRSHISSAFITTAGPYDATTPPSSSVICRELSLFVLFCCDDVH